MKKGTFFFTTLVVIGLASCSAEKTQNTHAATSAETTAPAMSHESHTAAATTEQKSDEPTMTADGLQKDLVCMVNNAYMGKKQYPVEFHDKMYYGCCEMCVDKIKNDEKIRVAVDPLTGKEVDKSKAFISLKPGSTHGEVLYFESEANYKKYIN